MTNILWNILNSYFKKKAISNKNPMKKFKYMKVIRPAWISSTKRKGMFR
jgi:hypothetical protein